MNAFAKTRRDFLKALGLGAAAALSGRFARAQVPKARPNILVIMSDDMGFSDLGCYGGEIHTPNLDALAAGGLRFSQFYNTARCCPTRASLLTGLYSHRAGVGHMMEDKGNDGYRGELSRDSVTFAEVLRPAGYATYMCGKWHVTKYTKPDGPKDNWPCQRGFDHFYGTIHGAGSFFDPNSLTRDNTQISPFADPEYRPKTFYYTDALSDQAVRFIDEHVRQTPDKPFFMYLAFTAAHWPMHAKEEDIAKYKGKYDGGYGPVRRKRFERTKELGLIDPKWRLSPQAGDWDKVENKAWEARCMEVYAAMIDCMDQGIGRIVETLKKHQALDNTLILFLQDNGGCAEEMGRKGEFKPRATRPSLPPMPAGALQPDMIPKQTRDGYPVRQGRGVMPGPADTYIGYGEGWANVSNTPFRRYKHWVHEGGIATPLIAHWPAGISARGGLCHQPAHLIDIMPTCAELAGTTYPNEYAGHKIAPLESRSLVPAFGGKTIQREAIFWEHEGNRAVRRGKWKLVSKYPDDWELYDMEADRTELSDLAGRHPEIVREMAALYDAWARRNQVVPWDELTGKGKKAKGKSKTPGKVSFDLKQGDRLDSEDSPDVGGRRFTVAATVQPKGDGVIVAQGGVAFGYSLYLEDGRLVLAVRNRGKLAKVAAAERLSSGSARIAATLDRDGTVTLEVDGRKAASDKTPGLVQTPADGLSVGFDYGDSVGDYAGEFTFAGAIENLRINLDR